MKFLFTSLFFLFFLAGIAQQFEFENEKTHQSPVNITDSKCQIGKHSLTMTYDISSEHLTHEFQSVEVDYDAGSYVTFDGLNYNLLQFHFHTPSEHLVNDLRYPMEMHIVHQTEDQQYFLVIALLLQAGEEDPFIAQFLNDVPLGKKHIDNDQKFLDINQELIPEVFLSYYHYEGSLTTPPYSENVDWIIDTRVHTCSRSQLERLVILEGDNHREKQKIYDRIVEKVISDDYL